MTPRTADSQRLFPTVIPNRFNGILVFILILILAIAGTSSVSAAPIDGVIGFRWNTSDSSPRLYQIDSDGTVIPNATGDWFNTHLPWSGMKTVVVNATNATPVLYGTNNRGDGLDLNGTYGDVMVEIPRFYTCSTYANGNFSYWISPTAQDALHYTVAPMFDQRGAGTDAGTAAAYYYVGRYDANRVGSNDATGKLQSATGYAPAVSMTINMARTQAGNKGAGWGITNIWTYSALRQLFYTEMVTLNSQTAWAKSRGVVDDAGNTVKSRLSGADSINTNTYPINATGSGNGLDGWTPVSYRGIENPWGNVWQFHDGVTETTLGTNVTNSTGLGLTGQATTFSIPLGENDNQSVGALVSAAGDDGKYQTNWTNTDVARPVFLPSAVGGSDSTYLSDYYFPPSSANAADPNILFSGGAWYDQGGAGVGSLVANKIASFSHEALGARLEFRFSAPGAGFSSRNISVATNTTSQGWAGVAPFTMVFNDTSTSTPTSWAWGRNNLTVTAWEQFSTTNNATQTFVPGNWSVNLTATNGGGSGISGITWVNVSAGAPPTFTSITPNSGTTAGGTTVTITGTNFSGATGVTFGGTTATSYTVDSATQITAVTPAKAAGAVNVVVTTLGGTATGAGAYTYVTPAPTPAPDNGGSDSSGPAAPGVPGKSSTSEVNVGGDSAVTHVAITGTGISGTIVTGTVVSGPGQNTAPPTQIVYEYVDITPARYITISEAVISFSVPVTWLTEHQLIPQNVVMYHLVGQTWVPLPTTLVKVVNGVAYYTAASNGFSRFAITGQFNFTSGTPLATLTPAAQTYGDLSPAPAAKTPAPAEVTARPVTTQTTAVPVATQPAPALPLLAIAFVVGVVVVLVAAGFLIRRWWIRRQNPALFRDYD